MLAALLALAQHCCTTDSWLCSSFPCTCLTCCCIYCATSGVALAAILGVARLLKFPKVVVVGKDGAARSRLVNLLQSAKYRVEVKDGDGGLSVLETGGEVWSIGPVQVDVARMAVIQADGTSVRLLPRELKILGLLTAEPGAVVSRETLMNEAWGFDYYGTTRTVDQTIANLRKKLGRGLTIESVRGEGYRLTDGTEE